MNLKTRSCPLCLSESTAVYAESSFDPSKLNEFAYASRKLPEYMHHRLLLCKTCDLVYASPVPQADELQAEYLEAAYDSQVEAGFAARTYAASINSLCDQLPDRKGALDIGAGDGAFCEELLKLRFTEVVGLEPSSAPIAAAAPKAKSCLRQEMFTKGSFSPGQFSLVTCFQTIEHVSEPAELCREAVELLKPGGALCLVAHNRRSLSCMLLGRKSPIFDIEHLQLFSPRSLRKLLTDAGLSNVTVKPLFNRYPLAYWMKLFPFPNGIKGGLLRGAQWTGIGKIPVTIPPGNLIAWGTR